MMGKRANTTKIVAKANGYLVLNTIRESEMVTVEGLIQSTGLSRPTVLKILKEFMEKGLVNKAGYAENEVGRLPTLYSLNLDEYFAIGIDIDGPPVYIAVSDLSGKLLYSEKFELDIDSSIEEIKDTLIENINAVIQTIGIEAKNIIGIGVGLPASINNAKGEAVMVSRLKALIGQPIGKMLSEELGISVMIQNDAHLIGIAEKRMRKEKDDVLCIVERSGIGMAIIIDDSIFDGGSGNAGFIGHITMDMNGRLCACGKRGCLEALSSKRAIREIYLERTGERLGYRQVLKKASEHDEVAMEVCREAGRYLGIGIANIVKTLDINTVIISDICCDEKHIFFKSIAQGMKEYIVPFFDKPVKLSAGKLKEEEMALGGCHYVIDGFFDSPQLILK